MPVTKIKREKIDTSTKCYRCGDAHSQLFRLNKGIKGEVPKYVCTHCKRV